MERNIEERNARICALYDLGYPSPLIAAMVENEGYRSVKAQTVREILHKCGQKRGFRNMPMEVIIEAISELLSNGTSSNIGYRLMKRRLHAVFGIKASRDVVALILQHLDPDGVAARRRQVLRRRMYSVWGPLHLIHVQTTGGTYSSLSTNFRKLVIEKHFSRLALPFF